MDAKKTYGSSDLSIRKSGIGRPGTYGRLENSGSVRSSGIHDSLDVLEHLFLQTYPKSATVDSGDDDTHSMSVDAALDDLHGLRVQGDTSGCIDGLESL